MFETERERTTAYLPDSRIELGEAKKAKMETRARIPVPSPPPDAALKAADIAQNEHTSIDAEHLLPGLKIGFWRRL
ncbi:MAG: hypothetical protein QHH02_01305 [Syntrophomonadaceae bacterium]|nr:hypothetical protein [Syntrophomonadaceae bacterium]